MKFIAGCATAGCTESATHIDAIGGILERGTPIDGVVFTCKAHADDDATSLEAVPLLVVLKLSSEEKRALSYACHHGTFRAEYRKTLGALRERMGGIV